MKNRIRQIIILFNPEQLYQYDKNWKNEKNLNCSLSTYDLIPSYHIVESNLDYSGYTTQTISQYKIISTAGHITG